MTAFESGTCAREFRYSGGTECWRGESAIRWGPLAGRRWAGGAGLQSGGGLKLAGGLEGGGCNQVGASRGPAVGWRGGCNQVGASSRSVGEQVDWGALSLRRASGRSEWREGNGSLWQPTLP